MNLGLAQHFAANNVEAALEGADISVIVAALASTNPATESLNELRDITLKCIV